MPLGDSPMALTLTPLGVTAGSPWRQPWGWESLIIPSPGGATDFACGKTGQTALPPHPGLTVANGLDANISHGLRRGLPAAATPWLNNLK